jgi:hypothetical protein
MAMFNPNKVTLLTVLGVYVASSWYYVNSGLGLLLAMFLAIPTTPLGLMAVSFLVNLVKGAIAWLKR